MQVLTREKDNSALILLAFFLAAAYLFPYHVLPFPSFYNDWLAVFGILIAAAYYLKKNEVVIRVPWIATIPVALAIVIALQAAFGMLTAGWDAVIPIAYFIVAAMTIILGATTAAEPQGSYRLSLALALAFVAAGLISVAIASLQLMGAEIPFVPFIMLMPHGTGIFTRPHANIAQPNLLALLFCMAIAAIWWLFQVGRVNKNIAITAVMMLLWGLTMTQSRIGWIIVPLFALINYFLRKEANFVPISNWYSLVLLAGYVAMAVVLLPIVSETMGIQTASVTGRVMTGSAGRTVLFQQALHISLSYPWFGAGWYQFGPQQLAIASDFPTTVYAHHSHNIVLNFAAEVGWPVTIIVFGTLGYWFLRACFYSQMSKQVGFATLIFSAMLVHSLLEFPLWYAYYLLPLALLIGMVHQERFGTRVITFRRFYLVPLLTIVTAGMLGIASDYRRVAAGFWALEMESIGMKTNQKIPGITIFPHMYDYFHFMSIQPHVDMRPEEIIFMEHTAKRFGGALVLLRLSQMYALNGREDDAVRTLINIQRLHSGWYKNAYEEWHHAPAKFQGVFRRLPAPQS